MPSSISRFIEKLSKKPKFIAVLTGAGVSAESGVPTFRDANGLWATHRIQDVACPKAFARDPELVHKFYNERRKNVQLPEVQPNAAHIALAKLQKEYKGGTVFLVTQNVDNLHERGGSTSVLHMHGELLKARCTSTGKIFPWQCDIVLNDDKCPCCSKVGTLRPHIVWFGEMPFYMDQIHHALAKTDLFISCGTSGNVYPAAGFARTARANKALTVEINADEGINASDFDVNLYGSASDVIPQVVEYLLNM